MPDEDVGQAQFLLQAHHQPDDLGLNGHVQSGDDLITHQERWAQRQRPGDVDALPLSAGKLVGKAVGKFGIQAHQHKHPLRQFIQLSPAHPLVHPLDVVPLQNDGAHGHPRVQRGKRVLGNHLQLLVQVTQLALARTADVLPVENDFTGCNVQVAHDAVAHRGLARPRLAHDAQRLATGDAERNAVHRLDIAYHPLQ